MPYLDNSHQRSVPSFPSGKDTLVFLFRSLGGILRSFVAARHFREHSGNDPSFKSFVNGGGTVTGITHVCRPIENVAEGLIFVRGICPRIIGDFLLKAGHGAGEAGELVKRPGTKAVRKGVSELKQ